MNETPVPSTPDRDPGGGFYAWIHSLRTVRAPQRWLGGVVAGLADRIGLDRTLGRALFVVLTFLTSGLAVLFYGLAWMLLPEPDGRIHAREAGQGRWTSGTTGALIVTILGLIGVFSPPYIGPDGSWWGFGGFLGLAVIGFFVWLVASRTGRDRALPPGTGRPGSEGTVGPTGPAGTDAAGRPVYLAPSDTGWYATPAGPPPASAPPATPPATPSEGRDPMNATQPLPGHRAPQAPPPAPPEDRTPPSLSGSTQLLVVGLALLAGAAVALLKYLDVFTAGWGVIWAASLATALGVLAVGIIIGAVAGRGGGGLTVTTAILIVPVLLATGGSFVRGGDWNNWDEDWNGVLQGNSTTGYDLSFGNAVIDLTDEPGSTGAGAEPIEVDVSFATAELVVPHDVDVFLTVDQSFSSVDYETFTATADSPDAPERQSTSNDGRIQIVDAPTDRRLDIAADVSFSNLNVTVEDAGTTGTGTTEQE